MSEQSTRLGLPFLLPAQAQKHVTHNEALSRLDLLVHLTVQAFEANTPPDAPQQGQIWALGDTPSGLWDGQGGRLAARDGDAWLFITPMIGWVAVRIVPEGPELRVLTDTGWVAPDPDILANLTGLGVNTTPDALNRLAVASPASLFSHDGADHQLKINKASAGDTASMLFQTDWSGRAEFGLTGTDDWSVKVSPDGSTWHDALLADRANGQISFPNGLSTPLDISSGGTGAITGTDARANLGLGSAAVLTAQNNADDLNAGRVIRLFENAGVFGWGVDNATLRLVPNNNLDSLRTSGIFRWASDAVGGPSTAGVVFHFVRLGGEGVGRHFQMAFTHNDGNYLRSMLSDGSWEPWRRLYTSGDIVGAVSQSGGTPTGAIIQRGSNANGEFVRFADGTQICTNGNNAITTNPAGFFGTVTSVDGDKLRIGRWF